MSTEPDNTTTQQPGAKPTTVSWGDLPFSRSAWADEHDVIHEFLPFAGATINAFEKAREIIAHLADRPVTTREITYRSITAATGLRSQGGSLPERIVTAACLRSGWVPFDHSSSQRTHYLNPDYCHLDGGLDDTDAVTDTEARIQLIQQATRLGRQGDVLAPVFGYSATSSLRMFVTRHHPTTLERLRKAGHRYLARTALTIHAWGEHDIDDIAAVFGVAEPTLRNWVRNHSDHSLSAPTERSPTDAAALPADPTQSSSWAGPEPRQTDRGRTLSPPTLGASARRNEALLADLRTFTHSIDHIPSAHEMDAEGPHSTSTYQAHFGLWSAAIDASGIREHYDPETTTPSADEILADIAAVGARLGHTPYRSEYRNYGRYTDHMVRKHFASWHHAILESTLSTDRIPRPKRNKLAKRVTQLRDELGRSPTKAELEERTPYPYDLYREVLVE